MKDMLKCIKNNNLAKDNNLANDQRNIADNNILN